MNRPLVAGLVLAATLLPAAEAAATTTRVFRQTTVKDFEEGEATATAVAPPGDVVPGMKTARLPIEAGFAWCGALARDGATAYFGTGDRGRIYAVGKTGSAQPLAEIDAPWVTALAIRSDGTLLAGTTPGGRVFAVEPKTGKSRVLAKVGAEHVWAVAAGNAPGTTFVATGDPGKVFAIDGKGGVRLVWDSGDKHVIALAVDGGGPDLLAGTADKAILYRIRPDGRAEALHDFDADEVRAIVRTKGATYLAVNDFDNPAEANQPAPLGPQAAKGTRITVGPAPASPAIPRTDAVKARAAIYRLDDDGGIEQLFALADGYFTSLVLDGRGNLFAASGSQGKVYRIAADRTVALVADLPERQALALLPASDGFLVGTGDIGAIYRVRPAVGAEATYLSKVLDADAPARWGRLWWTGSPDLVLETRSGNTGKPDGSWSGFLRVAATAHHAGENVAEIRSPGARYLQYRATLPGPSSVLRDIAIYYLPHNQRARVTEVFLADAPTPAAPGTPAQVAPSPAPGAVRSHASLLKLRWKGENPDNDELVYRLWFRHQEDTLWRPLGGPEPLGKPEYDWNTDSVADGRYVIRVWSSDEKVTPAGQALEHTFESSPFLVDNTKPEVLGLAAKGDVVTGRAHDATSVITTIEYAVDGGEWRPALPDDGLLDERDESFSVRLPKSIAAGPHIVNVRAWDSADNVGSARLELKLGPR